MREICSSSSMTVINIGVWGESFREILLPLNSQKTWANALSGTFLSRETLPLKVAHLCTMMRKST